MKAEPYHNTIRILNGWFGGFFVNAIVDPIHNWKFNTGVDQLGRFVVGCNYIEQSRSILGRGYKDGLEQDWNIDQFGVVN